MSELSNRTRKHLARIERCPRDYEWKELKTLLNSLGFKESQRKGAAVQFRHPDHPIQYVQLHKPHGRNPLVVNVRYVEGVVARLKEWGYL